MSSSKLYSSIKKSQTHFVTRRNSTINGHSSPVTTTIDFQAQNIQTIAIFYLIRFDKYAHTLDISAITNDHILRVNVLVRVKKYFYRV